MWCIRDKQKGDAPVKSGFKTARQANKWARNNLPKDETLLYGEKIDLFKPIRYIVQGR